jgi:L,D-peptidoglycan transpeptidase YkuD (ErfK/YbiS/YcfS/YnhG family)
VSAIRVDAAARRLVLDDIDTPCAIGRGGACPARDKREGDGCTPLGLWPVRGLLLRPGRVPEGIRPKAPWRWTRPDDGWSDDPADPAYNRPVLLPRTTSAETLRREDHAYDVIVVLGHNDAPPVPGMGSAIFLHIWVEGRPTEGCVAIAKDDMLRLLPLLEAGTAVEIV